MIAILTVLLAFVLGLKMTSWFAANVTYALAYLWAFTFQTLYLLLDSLGNGDAAAFEAGVFPLGYGLATLAVLCAGFGLVAVGHAIAARRAARANRGVVSPTTPAPGQARAVHVADQPR